MSQFRNLVFEGGGVKGIAYAGALCAIEKRDILGNIKRVAGTSAGAIIATLLALRASSDDVKQIVGTTKFAEFMDDSFGVVRDINRLLNDYGWYKGDTFCNWIQKHLQILGGNSDLTFRQLAEKGFLDLSVIGTDLSTQLTQVYSVSTTPDFPIWLAVRISMSIPLYFASVKRENQIFVDGGLSWNYPIDIYDEKQYVENPLAAEPPNYDTFYNKDHIFNKETLGFRVSTRDSIRAEKDSWNKPPEKITDFFDYIKCLAGFMTEMANSSHIHTNDWQRTVFIDAAGVHATDFRLPQDKINLLIENGETGVNNYFHWFDNSTFEAKNKILG